MQRVDDLACPGQGVGAGISPLVSHTSLLPGIMADTSFGRAQVGGVEMDLTINAMFGLICSFEGKGQIILSDCTKNTGIHFGDLAYASEKEFALAYHAANPSGAGIAGFVDFISFWNFSAQLAGDTSAFLTQERNAKAVRFSKTIDAKHAFSMSTYYPAALAGSDKIEVSINATLDVLKSVETWRGGTGDGAKEKLTLMMSQAVKAHKRYCEDNVPVGWLREHALKSGMFVQQFWLSLASYIEDEIILLQTFKLPEKSICLLMSHQVIQICNDLVEFRTNGRNVSFDSPEVGARYAWVALQSLQCMDGYLQAKFRCHQGINATFMRFLTRTMADQMAVGLKGQIDKLEKQVKALIDKLDLLATKKSFHDIDTKLEGIINANSLKRKSG